MPYTPTSPTLRLCDQLVTYLQTQWGPLSPNLVTRRYVYRFDLDKTVGRIVAIFPIGNSNRPAERGHDFYEHTVRVLCARRYTDAADPDEVVPRDWVDQEVDFVHQYIVDGFDFTHDETSHAGTAPFNVNLQTLSIDNPVICDFELLRTDKEFWCELDCVFRELILS